MSQFGAISFLPSGKVFLGESGISTMPSAATGLWVADSLDEEPVKLAEYPAQCLAYQESTDTLFACQYRTFGKVDQETGEYTQLFSFNDVDDFVDCPDLAKTCERQLCQDYCGIGHFATAPVCNVYTDAGLCGPCAAMVDNGADAAMCTATGKAGSGAAGSGGAGGISGTAGMLATAGTTAPPRAGTGMPSGGKAGEEGGAGDGGSSGGDDDDGGSCSCSSVGAGRSAALPVAFGAMMALALGLRRRKSGTP
jgi:MYXO-CTERM domain-containing protein